MGNVACYCDWGESSLFYSTLAAGSCGPGFLSGHYSLSIARLGLQLGVHLSSPVSVVRPAIERYSGTLLWLAAAFLPVRYTQTALSDLVAPYL